MSVATKTVWELIAEHKAERLVLTVVGDSTEVHWMDCPETVGFLLNDASELIGNACGYRPAGYMSDPIHDVEHWNCDSAGRPTLFDWVQFSMNVEVVLVITYPQS